LGGSEREKKPTNYLKRTEERRDGKKVGNTKKRYKKENPRPFGGEKRTN